MRQRLGLAGALLGSPELLVLDEPTDGIDPLGRVEVRRVLLEEKARGATLLLNAPYGPDEVWDQLPAEVQRTMKSKKPSSSFARVE